MTKIGQQKTTYGGKNIQDQYKMRKQTIPPVQLKHTRDIWAKHD
jgi:hypothetical protein